MPQVEVYSSILCPYCYRAKKLLKRKGVTFREIQVIGNSAMRREMIQRAGGGLTVPQIFVDGHHIGGFDELYALEREGRLDALLGLRQ